MIADQIYAGIKLQQGRQDVLTETLASLGQSIVSSLQTQAAQKQMQQALPMMQTAYKSALDKIRADDVSGGYADLVGIQTQFGGISNPFIQNLNANLANLTMQAGEMKKSELFRQAQYGGGGRGIPATQDTYTEDEAWATGGGAGEDVTTMDQGRGGTGMNVYIVDDEPLPTRGGMPGFEAQLRPEEERFEFSLSGYQDSLKAREDARQVVDDIVNFPDLSQKQRDVVRENSVSATVPKGMELIPFSESGLATVPGLAGIAGPAAYEETTVGTEVSTERGATPRGRTIKVTEKEVPKTEKKNIEKAASFATFKDALIDADNVVASDPDAFNIVKGAGYNYDRIQIQATDPAGERSSYNLFVDGKKVEGVEVSNSVGKAIEFMKRSPQAVDSSGYKLIKTEAPAAAPAAAAGGSVAERVRAQYGKKEGAAQPTTTQPAPTTEKVELTLEERIAAKTKPAAMPTRTATPQQQATLERTRQAKSRSNLETEKTRLERIIYETPRGGQRKLKAGLTQQDPDVKEVLAKITEINKQLEGL